MTQFDQDRPYYDDSTASRLLSEVKHRQVRLVLRQGTTLESLMLIFLPHPIIFASFYNTLTSTYYSLIQCSNCFKKERDDFASLMLSSSSYNIAIFSHHPGVNNALQTYATNDTPSGPPMLGTYPLSQSSQMTLPHFFKFQFLTKKLKITSQLVMTSC